LKDIPTIQKSKLRSLKEGIVLIAPSQPYGVDFLLRYNAWGFIRSERSPDYFALYVSSPESRIIFFGEIKKIITPYDPDSPISQKDIMQYGTNVERKKIVLLKPNSLKRIGNGIPKGVKKGKVQGIKYVTLSRFINASTLDDL